MKNLFLFLFLLLAINATCFADNIGKYRIIDEKSAKEQLDTRKFDENSKVIFIVDYSNSMNEKLGSRPKLEIALETLTNILPHIPKKVEVGLRIYGHRGGFTYFDGCKASKMAVPLAQNNTSRILYELKNTKATGFTPITYSLKQTVNKDFAGVKGKKHIILLSDGGENCDESPCSYAIELTKNRSDITIDVIAFDIFDEEANSQLRCTALATSGKFYSANSQQQLKDSLFESLGVDKEVKGQIKIK